MSHQKDPLSIHWELSANLRNQRAEIGGIIDAVDVVATAIVPKGAAVNINRAFRKQVEPRASASEWKRLTSGFGSSSLPP
jgi:hypothetical protein